MGTAESVEEDHSESDEILDLEVLLKSGATGVVKQYFDERKYGFIRVDDTYNKVFFHISMLLYKPVEIGDNVSFDLHKGPKGYFAKSVEFLRDQAEDHFNSESDEILDPEVLLESDATGMVKQYFDERKYGFITVGDTYNKVFFHISNLLYKPVEVGDKVSFDLHKGPKGYFAKSVKFLNQEVDHSNSESGDIDPELLLESAATGVLKRYFDTREYGFITVNDTYNKVFFHISEVSYVPVEVGDKVSFDLYKGPKGYFAKSVEFLNQEEHHSDWELHHKGQGRDCSSSKHGTGKTTISRTSREKGNMFFKSACNQACSKAKLNGFESALECYRKAYTTSQKDDDLVSAAKNIGTASWKLAKVNMNTCSDERKVIHAYFKDALQHFSTAYTKRSCMVQEWAVQLETSIRECLDDIRTWIAPRNDYDQIVALKEYVTYLPECATKVNCYLRIATIYLRKGKDALEHYEYKKCQGYLDECCNSLEEGKKRCTGVDPSFMVIVTDLEKDLQYQKDVVQKCLSKARDEQARQTQERKEAQEKENAKDQLKGDLKKLERLKKLPAEKFVEQVYKEWPPKGDGSKPLCVPSSSSSSRGSERKVLIRAISQYHPDKVALTSLLLCTCQATSYPPV